MLNNNNQNFFIFIRGLIDKPTLYILAFGISIRLIIFIFLAFYPLQNVAQGSVGPTVYQTGADINHYLNVVSIIKGEEDAANRFIDTYKKILNNKPITDAERYAGPTYPLMLLIFNYNINNTVLFSSIAFLIALIIYAIWQIWLIQRLGYLLAIPFIFLFQVTWFGIFIYPDIFYFGLCTYIYFLIRYNNNWHLKSMFWISLILLSGIRPNALAIVLFCLIVMIINKFWISKKSRLAFGSLLFIFLVSSFYYFPYAVIEDRITHQSYFFADEIINNIGSISIISQNIINKIINTGVKFFWLFGIHPSDSGNIIAFIFRLLTGGIFIIGFFKGIIQNNIDSILIALIIVPIIIFFPPSWRQILPTIPILYYYGMLTIFNKSLLLKPIKNNIT